MSNHGGTEITNIRSLQPFAINFLQLPLNQTDPYISSSRRRRTVVIDIDSIGACTVNHVVRNLPAVPDAIGTRDEDRIIWRLDPVDPVLGQSITPAIACGDLLTGTGENCVIITVF